MTAQSAMTAMYPPQAVQSKWNPEDPEFPWQPIPIHSVPKKVSLWLCRETSVLVLDASLHIIIRLHIRPSIGQLVDCSDGQLVGRSFGRSVGGSVGRCVGRSYG